MAVKHLTSESKEHQEDFKQEAVTLKTLRHPNIVNFLGLIENADKQVSPLNFSYTCQTA